MGAIFLWAMGYKAFASKAVVRVGEPMEKHKAGVDGRMGYKVTLEGMNFPSLRKILLTLQIKP